MFEGLGAIFSDPAAWAALITLVVMEVVLGIDNLIFISILSNKLPPEHRQRTRRIGIGLALIIAVAALDSADEVTFMCILFVVGGLAGALQFSGLLPRVSMITASHYGVTIAAAFVAAIVFPFTQGTNGAYLSIAVNVAIFAAAAIGLNIVVGLAGLLLALTLLLHLEDG